MKTLNKFFSTQRSLDAATVSFLFVLPFIFFWRQTLGWLTLADGDAVFWFYPAYQFVAEQLRQGRLPLWNPYLYSGTPLFAQWQAGALDPLNWIFLLGLTERTLTLAQQLTFSLALLGMYGYVRQLACRRRAAVFAALIYALSGFAVARTIYPGFLHIFALTPWIFIFLERLALQRRWRDAALGALFVAWQLFAAHPQPFLYAATMAAVYVLFRMDWRVSEWRQNGLLAAQAAVVYLGGLGLAAIQLLPVIDTARQSVRQEWPYALFTYNSLHPVSLLGTLFPFLHGQGRGIYRLPYWGPYWHSIEAAVYLGGVALSFAIVCGIAAWRWRRDARWSFARFWSVVAVAGIALALGRYVSPLARALYHVPVWSQMRSPNRHWLEVIFAVAVLCGLLMQHCMQEGLNDVSVQVKRWLTRAALMLTSLTLVVGWLGLQRPGLMQAWLRALPDLQDMPPNFLRAGQAEFLAPMLCVPLAALAVAYFIRAPQRWSRYALLLATVLLDFQLYAYYAPISNGEKNLTQLLGKGFPPALIEQERAAPPFRSHLMLPPDGNEFNPFGMYGHEFIAGYDPLLNTRYKTFTRIDEAGRTYSTSLLLPPDTTLDFLNVRYVLLSPASVAQQDSAVRAALQDATRWRALPNDGALNWYKELKVYENLRALPRAWLVGEALVVSDWYQQLRLLRGESQDEQGRAFDPRRRAIVDASEQVNWQELGLANAAEPFAAENVRIVERHPGRLLLETDAPRPSLLVLSEMAYPGWQATVDGQAAPWQRVNYLLSGVPLPAGKHRVEFVYRPASVRQGALVTFIVALALLGVWAWGKKPLPVLAEEREANAEPKIH